MIENTNDKQQTQSNITQSSIENLGTKTGTQKDPPDDQIVQFGDPVLETLFKKAFGLEKRPGPFVTLMNLVMKLVNQKLSMETLVINIIFQTKQSLDIN